MDEKNLAEGMPPTIGRYKVLEGIGFGAMGAVYKAFDPLIKRTLAIKTIRLDIPRQSPQYKSFIDRFQHEARISGTLSHPNIVTLFDIGEEGGVPYLAMEFVEGQTIANLVEQGTRFKPERVIALVSQIASALDYAHSKGVIHRDVKPANLMLSDSDRVKVTDFGIAKLVDAEMTQSGTLLGTPSYMSPEQAMGDKLDGRSDIFSLGVCAFEMLSGEQPFPGTNVTSILYKLVHVDPIEPANLELAGLVPQKWQEVFGKVLAKKPEDRYQTAGAFVRDLEYCLGSWFGALGPDGSGETIIAAPTVEDSPATIRMQAPEADDDSPVTVMLKAPPAIPPKAPPEDDSPATVMLKAPARPAAAPPPPPEEADSATVVLSSLAEPDETPATIMMPSVAQTVRAKTVEKPRPPVAKAKADPPAAAKVGADTDPLATPVRPGPPVRRSGAPLLAILGGGALLFLIVAAVGAWVVLKKRAPEEPGPVATPAVEAVATPAPATPTPAAETAIGVIRIETQPPGAVVNLGGETKGASPIELTALPFGAYEVKVELKGYEPRRQTVEVTAEAPQADLKIALARIAPVMVAADVLSTPFGAAVTVDGAAVGTTPVTDLRLKPGSRKIELAKEGYEPWSQTVSVQPGKRTRVDAQLKVLAKATPAPAPTAETVDVNHVYPDSEVDTKPRRTSGASVGYPENAPRLRSGDSASVAIEFVVSETGEVSEAKVIESAGKVIDEAVLAAVRAWKYSPGIKKGTRVKVRMPFRQTFRAG